MSKVQVVFLFKQECIHQWMKLSWDFVTLFEQNNEKKGMWVVFPPCHAHAGTNHGHLKFHLRIAYMNIELWRQYFLGLLHSSINFSPKYIIVENRSQILSFLD